MAIYILLTFSESSQYTSLLKLNLRFPKFEFFVQIKEIIDYLPSYCVVEYVKPDLKLPKFIYDHVKIFKKESFQNNETKDFSVIENELNRKCWDYQGSYVHLRNMYCCFSSSFCTQNMTFITLDKKRALIRPHENGPTIGNYEFVLSVGHYFTNIFGHFINDICIPLLIFPKEILDLSYIVLYHDIPRSFDFHILGINPQKIIYLKSKQWIFAMNFYTVVDPLTHLSHFGKLSNSFSKRIRNYYQLNSIIPTKYFITNRKPNRFRYIANMNDLINTAILIYPERSFSKLEDIRIFKEASLVWATAKLIIGPTGSNLFKHYAMANKTILIIISSCDFFDESIAISAGSHDVFTLFMKSPNMKHFSIENNIINITEVIHVINIGLFCVDNGHFNPYETFE